jgi:hypothetical protein
MQIAPTSDTATVIGALKSAAQVTGSDFNYLLGTAMRESSLKPNAQSSTSSAAGLFQFVDQTWLGLVKSHGAKYGLANFAGAISQDAGGRFHAGEAKDAILALKKDPHISALMAGEYAKGTEASMRTELGRPVCGGELYAAHFLGADSACKLIRFSQSAPGTSAASLFPQAAGANKSVFYHADGKPKSVREVYDWAMQQPAASAPAVAAPAAAQPQKTGAVLQAAQAMDANLQALLSDVMNWQPSGFFSTSSGALNGPLVMSQGLLDVFSAATK